MVVNFLYLSKYSEKVAAKASVYCDLTFGQMRVLRMRNIRVLRFTVSFLISAKSNYVIRGILNILIQELRKKSHLSNQLWRVERSFSRMTMSHQKSKAIFGYIRFYLAASWWVFEVKRFTNLLSIRHSFSRNTHQPTHDVLWYATELMFYMFIDRKSRH